jgi:hypothetical protein
MIPNNGLDELIPRPQAAKFLREQFPDVDASVVAHACWRAYSGREECSRTELVEALRHYAPPARRDFRLKK